MTFSCSTGCDDIIRQHKAACLRVISLLTSKDLLWVGTSAGVILTLPLPHLTATSTKITTLPNITGKESLPNILLLFLSVWKSTLISGIPHGHTGHVRFLTCVEMTPGGDSNMKMNYSSARSRYTRRSVKSKDAFAIRRQSTSAALASKLLVISGGYGYEDFRNTTMNEVSGREDSTNHLLLWQVWHVVCPKQFSSKNSWILEYPTSLRIFHGSNAWMDLARGWDSCQ